MALGRSWLFVGAPVAVAALVLVILTALRLARVVGGAVVASVPLVREQRVAFDVAGPLTLSLAAGRFTRPPAGLHFGLAHADGASVALRPVTVRTRVSGTRQVRVALYDVVIPRAGTYVVRVDGLDAASSARDAAVVFSRPIGATLAAHVVGLVVLGATFVGALVVSGLALAGQATDATR